MNKKPNLVYMFADQLRVQSVGYYGDSKAKTPNIDALAKESCDLCEAVSGHPVCAPYRASLFTGKYTTSTGMVINEIRISPNHRTMAHVFNDAGYENVYIGKWHMYANEFGNHFDSKNSYIPKGPDRLGFDGFFAAYNFHHVNYGENSYYHLDSPEKIHYDGFEPDCQTDMALNHLERLAGQDKPFSLFLSIGTPHPPWTKDNVPKEYYDLYTDDDFDFPENYLPDNDPYGDAWSCLTPEQRAKTKAWLHVYYSMIANVDYNVGRVLKKLDELGIADDTIFVFTSDHGELFGAHGRAAKNIFYEESVRVPFLVRWGKNLPSGKNDVCLNTVDIMPTLLKMMELPIPEEVEGRDLSDAIMGKDGAFKPDGALMMGTGATATFKEGFEWRAFRNGKYTYGTYLKDGAELLFDNENDLLQLHDLSQNAEYADVLNDLKAKMKAEMERVNDKFHPIAYYRDNWIVDRIIQRNKAD